METIARFDPVVDKRGEITDLLRDTELDGVTLIHTVKGGVRGNHYHEQTAQYSYILKGLIRWVSEGPDGRHELLALAGDLVYSPPNESHAMIAEEDSEMLVFTRGPRQGLHYESDTFRLSKPLIGET